MIPKNESETDEKSPASATIDSQIDWLVRRVPDEWEVVEEAMLAVALQRGEDRRVIVDTSKNKAVWEEKVAKSVVHDTVQQKSDRTEMNQWVWKQRDEDESNHICQLVLGRLWWLNDNN